MAPIKDAVGPSQEALLKLEKSTEDSSTQLAAAARILKLDLSDDTLLSAQDLSSEVIIKTRPAPKEEWVLRWLLKRFKVAAYRVEPLSFVLLRRLLQRISRRAIATTFVEYNFAQLLKDIVDDLDNAVFKPLRDGTGRWIPSGSDTSETVGGSPVRSKKRKRGNGDEDIEMQDAAAGQDDDSTQADLAVAAYVRFLDALNLLMSLVNNQDDRGNVSQFHLQQSLRFDPATVAQILGKFLRLSAALVVRFTKEKRNEQLLQLLKTTAASFGLWDLRKSGFTGAEKNSIDTAFSESCLLEALRLHRIVLSTGIVSDDVSLITRSIEKLIALHVVLPARNTFRESGGSGIEYSKDEDPDWSAVQPVTATFKPLFEDRSGVDIDCSGMHAISTAVTKKDPCAFAAAWQAAELVPTFYNIVARSVPRDSFRRQNIEASWLETVFVALAELAFSSTLQLSGNISGFVPLLEQLFIVVRARKVNLSLHTFLTHAAYTGLLKGKQNPKDVRWSLTTLLIDLGVDIFLPNSGFKDSSRLLDALLQSLQHIRSDSTDKETYQTVKEKVVIPLLRAFAAARDLSTFVELWYEQLHQIELERRLAAGSSSSSESSYSVWEDDDLAAAYRDAIKTSLSDTNVKAQIETAIPTIITSSGRISHSPESYAHFVILEAGSQIWGHNGLPGLRIDLVTRLVEVIHKSISTRVEKLHWSWRLWRLARNLIPISLKTPLNTLNDLAKNFEQTALKVMSTDKIVGRENSSNTWKEALEAGRFLFKVTKDLHHNSPTTSESEPTTLSNLFQNICSLLDALLTTKKKKLVGWNGHIQDLDTLYQLGTAYVECVLEFPHVWSPVTSESVKQFVDYLSVLAKKSLKHVSTTTDATHISFGQLWSVFTSYDYLVENPALSSQIAYSICALLLSSNDRGPFLLRFLPSIPVRLSDVSGFKETMNTVITENKGCPTECVQHVVSLINSYCQESQHIDSEVIEWITALSENSLQGLVAADMRTIESFRSLVKMVFECEQRKASKSAGTQKSLKRFYKLATDSSRVSTAMAELESDPANTEHAMSLTPVFVGACLRLLWEHHEELDDSKVSKDIRRQRDKMFKLLLARVDKCNTVLQEGSSDQTEVATSLATTLQILDVFDDLVRQKDVGIDEPTTGVSDVDTSLQKITRCQRIARSAASEDDLGFNDSTLLEGVDLHRMQASEQQYFAREATAKLKDMSNADRIRTIHELRESGLDGPSGASRLLLVGLAVSVLDEIAEKDSAEAREVSSLCTDVTRVLQNSTAAIEQFSLAAECLDIILRLHPRGVTQFNIDNCLAAVCTTMYRETSPELASTIYTRLCRLLGTIVGLYRQQLGGRFHVLVPALQCLLKALFGSNLSQRRNNSNKKARSQLGSTLSVPHAVLFTRLLTSLCDPTVSAVSRPNSHRHGHDGLIDQTKKAKVIAGQHLRILIESYAQNMLEAPLKPDIKAALAPGLYAVLDAMPTESKRALNAGLDVSARAIFKTLHEDYVSFGKWNSRG